MKRVSYLLVGALSLVASLSHPAAARAQTRVDVPIFFDDFLVDDGGLPKNNFRMFNLWTVSAGSVDLVGPAITDLIGDPVFGRYVDLGGSTGNPGAFATRVALPFVAGLTYHLSFRYKSVDGNPHAARFSIGGKSRLLRTSNAEFQQYEMDFTVPRTTYTRLVFQGLGNAKSGIGIDTVLVSQATVLPGVSPAVLGGVGPVEISVGVSQP